MQRHAGNRAVLSCRWLERLEPSTDDGVDAAWPDARERHRHARGQGTVEAGTRADRLVVNGAPLAEVTRGRRRESLTRILQDGLADPVTLDAGA